MQELQPASAQLRVDLRSRWHARCSAVGLEGGRCRGGEKHRGGLLAPKGTILWQAVYLTCSLAVWLSPLEQRPLRSLDSHTRAAPCWL